MSAKMPGTLPERFWKKVDKRGPKAPGMTSRCWIWTSSVDGKGYGQFFLQGKQVQAHRLSFLASGQKIPVGKEVDHLCNVRRCVRPSHCEAVTHQENVRRAALRLPRSGFGAHNKAKKRCPQGHSYAGSNLYVNPKGQRYCMECRRDQRRRYNRKVA